MARHSAQLTGAPDSYSKINLGCVASDEACFELVVEQTGRSGGERPRQHSDVKVAGDRERSAGRGLMVWMASAALRASVRSGLEASTSPIVAVGSADREPSGEIRFCSVAPIAP